MKRRVKHHRTATASLTRKVGLAATLLVALCAFRSSLNVQSATVTDGATEQLKTNGVITIAPGGVSDSIMKPGNHGNIIASTGSIYMRPDGTTAGSRFTGNVDGTHDLIMTGKIDVLGGITLNGQRKTVWPEPDSWTSLISGGTTSLYPNDTSLRVNSGEQQDRPEAYGFGIYENSTGYSALNVSNTDGSAIDFGDTAVDVRGSMNIINGYLYVRSSANQQYYRTWTADNDGRGSKLSADKIDGLDTYFTSCNSAICLCVVTLPGQRHCQYTDAMDFISY